MPDQQAQPSGFTGTLKAKWGPLPVWAWLAIITVVLLGYWLYEQHKASAAGASSQAAAATPAQAGQPGVVVINQDDGGDTPPPEPGKPPKPQPDHDASPSGGVPYSPHKITMAEAKQLLGEHHTVYTRNRGGTYVPVTSLAGIHGGLYTGERAWTEFLHKKG